MSNAAPHHRPPAETPASPEEDRGCMLTIGALAELSGVTLRTLRYYEELDLISPSKRSQGRYRLYHPRTLKRVRAVLALQDLNYSLEDIQGVLGAASTSLLLQVKPERLTASKESLSKQLASVDAKLQRMLALKAELQEGLQTLESQCKPCSTQDALHDCSDTCFYRDVHMD
jgi:DNA-binding transcriptional MerR regulator